MNDVKEKKSNSLYDNLKKAHPEWSPQRLYVVAGRMMNANRESKELIVRK